MLSFCVWLQVEFLSGVLRTLLSLYAKGAYEFLSGVLRIMNFYLGCLPYDISVYWLILNAYFYIEESEFRRSRQRFPFIALCLSFLT